MLSDFLYHSLFCNCNQLVDAPKEQMPCLWSEEKIREEFSLANMDVSSIGTHPSGQTEFSGEVPMLTRIQEELYLSKCAFEIGEELKKKMQGNFSDSEDDDGNLLEQARTLLAETEQDEGNEKKKGLFQLDFMKKGLEAQRERA